MRCLQTDGLELGGGLEVLLAAAFDGMAAGERSEILTPSRSTALELHGWARLAGHPPVGERTPPGGPYAVEIERGPFARVLAAPLPGRTSGPPVRGGELHTADLRVEVPASADPAAGFIPLGAIAELGAPTFRWTLNERDAIWADDVAELTEQASAGNGTPRATSRGRRPAGSPTSWSGPSPRS